MPADPAMAGGDPNAMPADPNAAAPADPNAMPADPSMGGEDHNAAAQPEGEEIPAEEQGGEMPEGADDSTMSLFAQLSMDDKETARKYIISMLNKGEQGGEQQEEPAEQPQMAESKYIFTKAQLKELNERLRDNKRKEDKQNTKVLDKHKNNKTPWGAPKFK